MFLVGITAISTVQVVGELKTKPRKYANVKGLSFNQIYLLIHDIYAKSLKITRDNMNIYHQIKSQNKNYGTWHIHI